MSESECRVSFGVMSFAVGECQAAQKKKRGF